jgi:hypothetical protein
MGNLCSIEKAVQRARSGKLISFVPMNKTVRLLALSACGKARHATRDFTCRSTSLHARVSAIGRQLSVA